MKILKWLSIGSVIGTVLVLLLLDGQQTRSEVKRLTASLDSAELVRKVDSVEVVKWAVKTKTLIETVDIHDTVQVKELVQVAIGLRAAALASVASASGASVAASNLIAALKPPRLVGVLEVARDIQRPDIRAAAEAEFRIRGNWHAVARAEHTFGPNQNASRLLVVGRYRF